MTHKHSRTHKLSQHNVCEELSVAECCQGLQGKCCSQCNMQHSLFPFNYMETRVAQIFVRKVLSMASRQKQNENTIGAAAAAPNNI